MARISIVWIARSAVAHVPHAYTQQQSQQSDRERQQGDHEDHPYNTRFPLQQLPSQHVLICSQSVHKGHQIGITKRTQLFNGEYSLFLAARLLFL